MDGEMTTTFWRSGGSGDIRSYAVGLDEQGAVLFESGDAPPPGAEILGSAALTSVLGNTLAAEKAAFESQQAARVAWTEDAIAAREAQVAELVAGGMSSATAEAILPAITPDPGAPYVPPADIEAFLAREYLLDPVEVDLVMARIA